MSDNDPNREGRRPGAGGPTMPRPRMAPWLLIGIVVIGLLVMNGLLSNANTDSITYSEFRELAETRNQADALIHAHFVDQMRATGRGGRALQVMHAAGIIETLPPGVDPLVLVRRSRG